VLLLVRRARLPTPDDNLCRHHPYPHTLVETALLTPFSRSRLRALRLLLRACATAAPPLCRSAFCTPRETWHDGHTHARSSPRCCELLLVTLTRSHARPVVATTSLSDVSVSVSHAAARQAPIRARGGACRVATFTRGHPSSCNIHGHRPVVNGYPHATCGHGSPPLALLSVGELLSFLQHKGVEHHSADLQRFTGYPWPRHHPKFAPTAFCWLSC
jgi:hypothetical protein